MDQSVPGQGDWSNLGSDLYGILTGGLQKALDLEIAEGRSRIEQQSTMQDTPIYVRNADDATTRAGESSGGVSIRNPLVVAGAVVVVLVIGYLIAKS